MSGARHQSGVVERGQRRAILLVERQRSLHCARSRLSHSAKFGAGDRVTKVRDARHFARNFLDHLLDQEMAEAHAGKPALAIGDRVEHRRRRPLRFDRLALVGQDRRDRAGDFAGQRHLDENQRLVDQRRMKEGVAAPVGRIDAPAQIVPVADLVHRFVADDLFQDRRRASTNRCGAAPGSRD